jgi:CBS domain containing-hemolysin-like protein
MKQLNLKQCVTLLRICILLFVLSVASFFLFSEITKNNPNEFNKQVIGDKQEEFVHNSNVNRPSGEFNIFSPGDNMISPLLSLSY